MGAARVGPINSNLYPGPLQLKPAYAADRADCRKEETPRGPTRGLSLPLDGTGHTRNAGLVPSSCHQQTNNEYARPRFRTQTRATRPCRNALRERKAPTQRLFVLGAYQGHTGDQKAASLRFLSHAHEPLSQLIE
jgi:hypothetical protein